MPLILKRTTEMSSAKKIRFNQPSGMSLWGKPDGDVRYICGTDSYAVYVIEQRPGRRKIRWDDGPHTLWFPWIYFFIKIPRTMRTSTSAPAYILISRERQKTLEEKTLMVPYLTNLFGHGGICPDHNEPLRGIKPVALARKFISWFWRSPGTHVFTEFAEEPVGLEYSRRHHVIESWSKCDSEKVLKIQFQRARYESVKEAAHNLRFDYWARGGGGVDDMTTTSAAPVRKEIK